MTIYIFAEDSLMLWETARVPRSSLPFASYIGYTRYAAQRKSARAFLFLHILFRPINLALASYFAYCFNARLAVDLAVLRNTVMHIKPQDKVLWLNPSLAVCDLVDEVFEQGAQISLYFLDPIHRLGISTEQIHTWAKGVSVATYSAEQAAKLHIEFVAPFAPAPLETQSIQDLDVVYIGSPSPKRLLWIITIQIHLWIRRKRGFLRLASRNKVLSTFFPSLFCKRISFSEYVALCARSRGVLEIHERDAGGVTLRATLCQSINTIHLCNLPVTQQTVHISLFNWKAMDRFLSSKNSLTTKSRLQAPELKEWLLQRFNA